MVERNLLAGGALPAFLWGKWTVPINRHPEGVCVISHELFTWESDRILEWIIMGRSAPGQAFEDPLDLPCSQQATERLSQNCMQRMNLGWSCRLPTGWSTVSGS